MRKRKSIYQFLIALLVFSLLIPAGMVGASTAPAPDNGSLTIHKFEREPGVEDGEDGDGSAGQGNRVPEDAKALEGVEFTITQTHSYNSETDEWNVVEDEDALTDKLVTDSDGLAVFHDLPLGRYTVQETDGPPHVNLNTEVFTVDIPMTSPDGTTVNYDVHIYPKNETIRGAVKLKKMDGKTKVALGGVNFELYDDNDNQVGTDVFTTNEAGYIYVSGLAYGKYYFKEVATLEGYALGDQRIEFSITKSGSIDEAGVRDGKVVKVTAYNFVEPEIEKKVSEPAVNRGDTVTYSITVNLPGDIHEYNRFVITDELDENLTYVDGSWANDVGEFDFDQQGQKLTWSVSDFDSFAGEESVTITFDAVVAEDATPGEPINNKAHLDFENKHGFDGEKETDPITVTPTAGDVNIIKVDGNDTSKKIKGAEFELRDLDGKVVAEGTTNKHGKLVFKDIDYGEYLLYETKAPNGYNKLRNPIEVTVNSDTTHLVYTVENFKSGWHLPKTGGMGTIPFTIIGLLIMGSAIYLYVRRRNQIA